MNGTMTIPLKFSEKDYTKTVISTDGLIGENFDGFHVDHIARVREHFEMAYTVTSPELIKKLQSGQLVTCSIREDNMRPRGPVR
jgi:hypothetical protein